LMILGFIAGFVLLASCSGDGSSLGPNGEVPDNDANGEVPDNDNNEEPGGDNGPPAITLAQLSNDIFTPNCVFAGCHNGSSRSGGMSLEASDIADEIIGIPSSENSNLNRIEPNDPDNSYLLRKLEGRDILFSQMPLGGRLRDDEIATIRAWIEAGAPQ